VEIFLILTIGILSAGGCYLLLQRRLLRTLIGLSILSQAVNLIIFTAGKVQSSKPAFILPEKDKLLANTADPIPQALILTAIVIGFAMSAFFVVLAYRVFVATGTDNMDQMLESDR
jgi:multicomponent Na+:H+ antiporter subunit C